MIKEQDNQSIKARMGAISKRKFVPMEDEIKEEAVEQPKQEQEPKAEQSKSVEKAKNEAEKPKSELKPTEEVQEPKVEVKASEKGKNTPETAKKIICSVYLTPTTLEKLNDYKKIFAISTGDMIGETVKAWEKNNKELIELREEIKKIVKQNME